MKNIITLGLFVMMLFPVMGQRVGLWIPLLNGLDVGQAVPDGLLSERSVMLYDPADYTYRDLEKMQRGFQRIGIDAVAYFTFDMIFANPDAVRSASHYFNERDISFLIFVQRTDSLTVLSFTRFSGNEMLVDSRSSAWRIADSDPERLLQRVYRTATQNQTKQNLLINDIPETDFILPIIRGKTLTSFPLDLKVDRLAVPLFDEASMDTTLVHCFQTNYPLSFDTVRYTTTLIALRGDGFLYVLKYAHAYEPTIRALLNHPDAADTAVGGDDYKLVYKFYVQNLVSGVVFLGTTWDADPNMRTGLLNYINALRKEFNL